MDQLATLGYALDELHSAVASVDESQMELVTNCAPWTVRQLASHALNAQLFWVGYLTKKKIVSSRDTAEGVPYQGDLAPIADDAIGRARAAWTREGILDEVHSTPFGELTGSAVINYPIVDALSHAWDLATSLGRPIEFSSEALPAVLAVVGAACTDDTRALGLFGPAAPVPSDATETERLMAAAGRTINAGDDLTTAASLLTATPPGPRHTNR